MSWRTEMEVKEVGSGEWYWLVENYTKKQTGMLGLAMRKSCSFWYGSYWEVLMSTKSKFPQNFSEEEREIGRYIEGDICCQGIAKEWVCLENTIKLAKQWRSYTWCLNIKQVILLKVNTERLKNSNRNMTPSTLR